MSTTYLIETTRAQNFTGLRDNTTKTVLRQCIDDAYQELASAHNWSWLFYEAAFSLEAKYDTGTVSVALGNTAVTTTGTWVTTWAGREIQIGTEIYGLSYVVSTWTLDRASVAAVVAQPYTMFRRKYSLAARMRENTEFSTLSGAPQQLNIVSPERLATLSMATTAPRDPAEALTFTATDSNLVSGVKLWPPPANAGSVYYSGHRDPAALTDDAHTFIFPDRILPLFRSLYMSKVWAYRKDSRSEGELKKYYAALPDAIEADPPSGGRNAKMELSPHVYLNRATPYPGRHSSGQ